MQFYFQSRKLLLILFLSVGALSGCFSSPSPEPTPIPTGSPSASTPPTSETTPTPPTALSPGQTQNLNDAWNSFRLSLKRNITEESQANFNDLQEKARSLKELPGMSDGLKVYLDIIIDYSGSVSTFNNELINSGLGVPDLATGLDAVNALAQGADKNLAAQAVETKLIEKYQAQLPLLASPTASPTTSPTTSPTISPTASPTTSPTASPTISPSPTPEAQADWMLKSFVFFVVITLVITLVVQAVLAFPIIKFFGLRILRSRSIKPLKEIEADIKNIKLKEQPTINNFQRQVNTESERSNQLNLNFSRDQIANQAIQEIDIENLRSQIFNQAIQEIDIENLRSQIFNQAIQEIDIENLRGQILNQVNKQIRVDDASRSNASAQQYGNTDQNQTQAPQGHQQHNTENRSQSSYANTYRQIISRSIPVEDQNISSRRAGSGEYPFFIETGSRRGVLGIYEDPNTRYTYLLPTRSRTSYEHLNSYFELQGTSQSGDVQIIQPAIVIPSGNGWQLSQKGVVSFQQV